MAVRRSPGCARPISWRSWPSAGCMVRATSTDIEQVQPSPLRHRSRLLGRGTAGAGGRRRGGGTQACVGIGLRGRLHFLADPATVEAQPVREAPPPGLDELRGLVQGAVRDRASATRTPVESMPPRSSIPGRRALAARRPRRRHRPAQRVDKVHRRRPSGRAERCRGWGCWSPDGSRPSSRSRRPGRGLAYVATPSVPSTLAVEIARRSGMVLVGRAVSGTPRCTGRRSRGQGSPLAGSFDAHRDLAAIAALLAVPP